MKTVKLSDYGLIIRDEYIGNIIYLDLRSKISEESRIVINFSGVVSIATFCARQIFGKLFLELGATRFSEQMSLENASDSVKSVISEAIRYSLERSVK